MLMKVIKPFYDKKAGFERHPEDKPFEVDEERAKVLINAKVADPVEEAEEIPAVEEPDAIKEADPVEEAPKKGKGKSKK